MEGETRGSLNELSFFFSLPSSLLLLSPFNTSGLYNTKTAIIYGARREGE